MIYFLVTHTCIYFLNEASASVISNLQRLSPSKIRIVPLTGAELYYGAEKSKARLKNTKVVEDLISTFDIVPFDEKSCRVYPKIRAFLEKAGTPIGPMDLLIGSISVANNFILVTNNIKEFKRVKGIKLDNWI
jgi:tRNA(fMet)-specific endonuclease VapC